jgi:hypothetical protein
MNQKNLSREAKDWMNQINGLIGHLNFAGRHFPRLAYHFDHRNDSGGTIARGSDPHSSVHLYLPHLHRLAQNQLPPSGADSKFYVRIAGVVQSVWMGLEMWEMVKRGVYSVQSRPSSVSYNENDNSSCQKHRSYVHSPQSMDE